MKTFITLEVSIVNTQQSGAGKRSPVTLTPTRCDTVEQAKQVAADHYSNGTTIHWVHKGKRVVGLGGSKDRTYHYMIDQIDYLELVDGIPEQGSFL